MTLSEERLRELAEEAQDSFDQMSRVHPGTTLTKKAGDIAAAYAELLSLRSDAHTNGEVDWRCAKCGCRSFARVDRLSYGGRKAFEPGDDVRCVNCKDVSFFPTLSLGHPIQGDAPWLEWFDGIKPTGMVEVEWRDADIAAHPRAINSADAINWSYVARWRPVASQPPTPAGVREITDEDYAANVASRLFPQSWGEGTGLTRSTLTAEVRAALAAAKGAGE